MPTASSDNLPRRRCAVIGAGIVGTACALHLQRRGFEVTLLDPREPGTATSFGNAGGVVSGAVMPTATPDLWRQLPRMLADRMSPLRLRPSYVPRMLPWLWRFMAASRRSKVEEIAGALAPITARAVDAHRELAQWADCEALLRPVGWLKLYRSEAGFAASAYERSLMQRHGKRFEILAPEEIRQLEPGLAPVFARGLFQPDSAFCVDPCGLTQAYARRFVGDGGTIRQNALLRVERSDGGRRLITDNGTLDVDLLVLAAGAWSARIAASWGERILLDTERGYHLSIDPAGTVGLRRPVLFTDERFVLAPMQDGIRLTSGVEFAGIEAPPDFTRIRRMLSLARQVLPGLGETVHREWMGWRPSTPDSLPVIGRSSVDPAVIHAFGHGHLGLTLSAITGRLVAELADGAPTSLDPAPYAATRF